jgi:hypothetical protein
LILRGGGDVPHSRRHARHYSASRLVSFIINEAYAPKKGGFMKHFKLFAFLFFGACLAALVLFLSAEVQQVNTKTDYYSEWLFSPADYPCLTEPLLVTGWFHEHFHWVIRENGTYHWQVIQTTTGMTAVGMDSGATYHYNGPLSYTENGEGDGWVVYYPFEFTFHNINHFVGPGGLQDVYFRTTVHGSYNWDTGQIEYKFIKEDVLCH